MAVKSKRKKTISRIILGISFLLLAAPILVGFCNFDVKIDKAALDLAVEQGNVPAEIYEGTKVVCFYSLVCPYCQKNAVWLQRTRHFFGFEDVELIALFGQPSEPRNPQDFLDATGLKINGLSYVDPEVFIRIVEGEWPKVLVLRNGKIIHKFTYREF